MKIKEFFGKKPVKTAAAILFWLAVWFLVSGILDTELLLPSPAAAAKALLSLCTKPDFFISCGISLLRVLAAWIAGLAAGLLLAVLTSLSRVANTLFSPLLHLIRATPVASFIVLALVLMRTPLVPVFTGSLMVIPIVWANTVKGIASPDKKLLETAEAFRMRRNVRLRYIYVPAVLPYLSAAATTSMGLAWKACIAAEVICTPARSIGAGIQNTKVYLETPSLFAWTATVIVLSVLLEKAVSLLLGGKNHDKN